MTERTQTTSFPPAIPVSPIWNLCFNCGGVDSIQAIFYTTGGTVVGRAPCGMCRATGKQP